MDEYANTALVGRTRNRCEGALKRAALRYSSRYFAFLDLPKNPDDFVKNQTKHSEIGDSSTILENDTNSDSTTTGNSKNNSVGKAFKTNSSRIANDDDA